jgi:hypothetical protein
MLLFEILFQRQEFQCALLSDNTKESYLMMSVARPMALPRESSNLETAGLKTDIYESSTDELLCLYMQTMYLL